jgi:hypothetical protein
VPGTGTLSVPVPGPGTCAWRLTLTHDRLLVPTPQSFSGLLSQRVVQELHTGDGLLTFSIESAVTR